MENLYFVLPEIFISLSIMSLLIIGVFKKNSSSLIHNISLIILIITTVIIFNETIEIKNHKWFLACQFHPEFKSKPFSAHPLFREFVKASLK